MNQQNSQQSEREILLSLADKDYSGTSVIYTPTSIKIGSLESTLKSKNYSPISWYSNYRSSANFKSASGFCVDSDHGMTLQQAIELLQTLSWNYFLITTRNHQKDGKGDRFRIFIPFNKTVYSNKIYSQIIGEICKSFPQSDPNTFDGARQLYGSPETAIYYSCWTSNDFDVDAFLKEGEWDSNLRVVDAHKKPIDINSIKAKTSIYCPFHIDSNASAFIEYSDTSKNHFIHCSSCGKSFWKIKDMVSMEERCKEFYSIGTGIFQISITAGEYSMSEIGEKKFFALIGAISKEERDAAYLWLMQNHHLKDLKKVEHIGDMDAKSTYIEVKPAEALIRVHYAPLEEEICDNGFVEDYLGTQFVTHKEFIKSYMAVYCYTNYRKLPFLILTGKRGAGKNSFAELIGEIFNPLSISWGAKAGQFTPEYEKKLLTADETVTEDRKQYLDLKRQSGSKYLPVNKKFLHPYQVRNNVNIIILSNARYPIHVERDEVPTDEKDNQFFVYKMERKYAQVDAIYAEKLRARLGHYIRTELKKVFDGLDINSYRYSIPVPITDYEKELFGSSVTAEEQYVDNILLRFKDAYNGLIPSYEPFFKKGLVPSDFIDDTITKVDKNKIVKQLRSDGYLTSDKTTRDAINKERKYCYAATPLLMTYLQS